MSGERKCEVELTADRVDEILAILDREPEHSTVFQIMKDWFLKPENFDRVRDVVERIRRRPERSESEERICFRWQIVCAKKVGTPYSEEFFQGIDDFITEVEEIHEIEDATERNRRLEEFWSRED